MKGKLLSFEWVMTDTQTDGVWLNLVYEGEVVFDGLVGSVEEGERIILNSIKDLHSKRELNLDFKSGLKIKF